jgi:hypothetical protein
MSDQEETGGVRGLLRKLLRDALWHIDYHEGELKLMINRIEFARKLLKRAGFDPDVVTADHSRDDDEIPCTNLEEFAYSILGDRLSSLVYHEEQLRNAHNDLALAKILMSRTGLNIPIEEVQAEMRKKEEK